MHFILWTAPPEYVEAFAAETASASSMMGYDLSDGRSVSFGPVDPPAEGFCISITRPIPGTDKTSKLVFGLTVEAAEVLFMLMVPYFTKPLE